MTANEQYPSLLYLLPVVLQTFFYTTNSLTSFRIIGLGYIISLAINSHIPFIFASFFSISTLLFAVQQSSLNYDIFQYYSLFASIIGIISASLQIYSKYRLKINISLPASLLIAFSALMSTSVFSIFILNQYSVFATGIIFACLKPLYGIITSNIKDNTESQTHVGFGIQTKKDDIFQIYEEYIGVLTILSIIIFTILSNFIGKFYTGFSVIFIILYCVLLTACSAIVTIILRQNKGIRSYFIQDQKQDINLAQKDDKVFSQNQEQSLKEVFKSIFKFQYKQVLFGVIMYLIFILSGKFYYRYKFTYIQYISSIPVSFLSQRSIFIQNSYSDIMFLIINLVCLYNYPLSASIHYSIYSIINQIEGKSFSTYLIIAAEFYSITFIDYTQYKHIWIAQIIITLLLSIQFIPILQKSPLGLKVIIYIQSFILDTVITIPREYQLNIITNTMVLFATAIYAEKFMSSAIGTYQSLVIFGTILIRVVSNIVNTLLLRSGLGIQSTAILQIVVSSYEIFSICVSLLLQIASYFRLPKKVQLPMFMVIYVILVLSMTFSPLSVIFITGFLFLTGFSQIISSTFSISSSTLQSITILVYKSFFSYQIPNPNIFLTRFLTGIAVSSASGYLFFDSPYFLSTFTGAVLSLFLTTPTVLIDMEITTLSISKLLISLSIFVATSIFPLFQKVSQKAFKVIYLTVYAILLISCLLSSQVSESFTLLIFLILLASLPQSLAIVSFGISSLLLVLFMSSTYSVSTISYASAVASFSATSIMFLLRFLMIKNSVLRRLIKKVKIENAGAKINQNIFNQEAEFDVFLNSAEQQNKGMETNRETAENVYFSLKYQLYGFIAISGWIFSKFGFSELVFGVLSCCVLLIPSDNINGSDIMQVCGYFSVNQNWQENLNNKQQKITRFVMCSFLLVLGRILYDFILFINELIFDYEANNQFINVFIKDIFILVLVLIFALTGICYITAFPLQYFTFLCNQRRVQLLSILGILALVASIFSTANGIKILLIFGFSGIFFQAPISVLMGEKRIVDVEST